MFRRRAADLVVDVSGLSADASVVDALARLQWAAVKAGRRVVVRRPSADLVALIDLMGLVDVLRVEG